MALIEVRCQVEIPDDIASACTNKQIHEWVRFSLNENGCLEASPISEMELTGKPFTADFRWLKGGGA